ncbi:agc family protein kinase [Stylonychia lemnae]|uniref:Agc family protein kinase n=1 Tax=Stylonychia lemnae TaxID=5949 RepID=A0A078ACV2_STYLE|nr:agc family protein kinase [Stylonychia lemnae]|eukprot:CDW80085.1 agc family protein kinase [Stylonychia lemnae]
MGTPGFIPPSVIDGEKYCLNSDIFSVGSIIYQMIAEKLQVLGLRKNLITQMFTGIERTIVWFWIIHGSGFINMRLSKQK